MTQFFTGQPAPSRRRPTVETLDGVAAPSDTEAATVPIPEDGPLTLPLMGDPLLALLDQQKLIKVSEVAAWAITYREWFGRSIARAHRGETCVAGSFLRHLPQAHIGGYAQQMMSLLLAGTLWFPTERALTPSRRSLRTLADCQMPTWSLSWILTNRVLPQSPNRRRVVKLASRRHG